MRIAAAMLFAIVLVLAGCIRSAPSVRTERKTIEPAAKLTHNFAVPVLMYHRVSPLTVVEEKNELVRDLTVLPEDFEAQVAHLRREGYALLSVYDVQKALLENEPLPERAVAITLDDGYRDNFEHAFPILQRHGASATIFLVKDTVDSPRHLTWEQILTMRPAGVRYGSHTVSHADLPSLEDGALDFELKESKSFLERGLREVVSSLAYPAGKFDDRVVDHVRQAGYLTAWMKGGGPVRPGDDPFRLPRVRVHGRTDIRDFRRKVSSGVWAMRIEAARRKVNS
jgi:peptidoglycan/xylan/chitin deacetylase (PgdA/CDA1 family)